MARKLRMQYAGAVYHVMARGNQGRDIYADDQDRRLWLEALAEGCEKKYIEGRVLELGIKQGREELAAEWKAIRRGWYLGGEQFRERMLELVEAPLGKGQASSYSGEAKWEHGEAEAERLLARGLSALALSDAGLAQQPKGGLEKQLLAWWLSEHTTARRRWVSRRLCMGDESRVTQAIRLVKRGVHGELIGLREKLEAAYRHPATPEK